MNTAVWVVCTRCGRNKKPLGRSAPMEMESSLCTDWCEGYRMDPRPECRWPGETQCSDYCTRGDS